MRDVTYLPGTEDREPIKQVDEITLDTLVNLGAEHGWETSRRGTTYAQLVRKTKLGNTEQISLSVVNGQLKASQVIVMSETDVSGQVAAWIEEER